MHLLNLLALDGVSGNEQEVRKYIYDNIKNKADEIYSDSLGNLIAVKKGSGKERVMLSAHMDEVGLIVSKITDDGFLKFKAVGGIDSRILVSKRVKVGKDKLCGVIGAKAIHLQEKSECETAIKIKDLYIDIGARDKKAAENVVNVGDYVAFDSDIIKFGNNMIKAKALDDRTGCAILMDMLDESYSFDLYASFLVQEEVGMRGAKVAVNKINPDYAIILEATTCSDVYGTEPKDYATELSKGVAVSIIDRSTLYDKSLTQFILKLAESNSIPVQLKQTALGGNDAGAVHLACGGIKTAALSIPARYIHSPSSVISMNDYNACKELVKTVLKSDFISKGTD